MTDPFTISKLLDDTSFVKKLKIVKWSVGSLLQMQLKPHSSRRDLWQYLDLKLIRMSTFVHRKNVSLRL